MVDPFDSLQPVSHSAGADPFDSLQAVQPSSAPAQPVPAAQPEQVSPIMSGVAGFNKQVETLPANLANLGAMALDKLGVTDHASQSVKDFYGQRAGQYQQDINQNPISGAIGQGVGAIAQSAPLFAVGGGAAALAAQGATSGYLGTDVNATEKQKLFNAGVGSALSVAIPFGFDVAKNTAGNIMRSIKPAFASPSDLAEIATQKTLATIGGKDMSQVTPELFFKNVDSLTSAAKVRKDALYAARDALAQQEGVGVARNGLKSVVESLGADAKSGATSETMQALREAKRLLGDGSELSYVKAQSLLSDIGSKINTANRQGNYALANKLTPIKESLLSDIQAGGGSEALQAAKSEADAFYKNVYNPLRDINAKRVLADNYADSSYMANALKSVTRDPASLSAFKAANENGLANQAEQMMQAAHVNALKEAATTDGMINPVKYANALSKTLKDNPTPFAPVASKLEALGKALDVAKNYQGLKADLSQHSLGQRVLLGAGADFMGAGGAGTGAAALSYVLPKAKYLYAAGKMLKNPETARLLSTASQISEKTDPGVVKAIYRTINTKFENQIATIPARLEPLFNGSSQDKQ